MFNMYTKIIWKSNGIYYLIYCSDPKGGSCIPWNPTSPKETHGNVLIRSDLPLMCRGIFPHCCVLWGRTKPCGISGPKADNMYTGGGGVVTDGIRAMP